MTSEKDRAENVMITDLVRNDISHFCIPGTVEVEELCGVHSFSHVHQMISTVVGEMHAKTTIPQIISGTFPMGSMTGAPKVKVMEYIEKYENFKRGLYSGSVGYIENARMDLNVVIRSLQFNNQNKRIAYHTGGAITYDSIGELEFQECLDKASGMMAIFES
jgi:para-aminobenzoate synthetase component 1